MVSPEPGLLRPLADGRLRLAVKLTPKAAKAQIQGVARDEAGELYLKVAVTAVPEQGKANQALIALLAAHWHLPKSAFTLIAGATQRRKILLIDGPITRAPSWPAAS